MCDLGIAFHSLTIALLGKLPKTVFLKNAL